MAADLTSGVGAEALETSFVPASPTLDGSCAGFARGCFVELSGSPATLGAAIGFESLSAVADGLGTCLASGAAVGVAPDLGAADDGLVDSTADFTVGAVFASGEVAVGFEAVEESDGWGSSGDADFGLSLTVDLIESWDSTFACSGVDLVAGGNADCFVVSGGTPAAFGEAAVLASAAVWLAVLGCDADFASLPDLGWGNAAPLAASPVTADFGRGNPGDLGCSELPDAPTSGPLDRGSGGATGFPAGGIVFGFGSVVAVPAAAAAEDGGLDAAAVHDDCGGGTTVGDTSSS